MNFVLLSQLIRGQWMIDPQFAQNQMQLVNSLLNGMALEFDENKVVMNRISAYHNDTPTNSQALVANIELRGTLFKNNVWCAVSMKRVGELIKQADADESITGIILTIDSPGGTVDGTHELGEIIANCSKPIVTYSDGLIASAAFWLAAQSDYIIADNPTCEIGSIGVMLSIADYEPAYKKQGVKFHTIYSNLSPDKNADLTAIKAGNYDEYRKATLDRLATEFIEKVKSGRPNVAANTLTGKIYPANDAVKFGLIDEIGPFDLAISKIIELSQKQDYSPQKSKIDMKKFTKIAALLAISGFESTKEGIHLSEEQLEAIEKALPSGKDPEPEPTPEPTPDQSKEDAKTIAALRSQIQSLNDRMKKMEKSPAVDPQKKGKKSLDFGKTANGWDYLDN